MSQVLKTILFIAILALTACNNHEPRPADISKIEDFDYGHIRHNTYINPYFNIKMDVPKDWQIQDDQQKQEMMKKGGELISGDNQKLKAAIKASEITTANLFTAFAHEPGTVNYNNNLVIIAENVGQFAVNITAEAYLANANNLIRNSKMDIVQIDNSFPKVTINEKDFHVMNLVTFVKGMHVHQTYLVTIDKGFALGFIYSYIDDAQKTEIEKAINSIRPYKKSSSS